MILTLDAFAQKPKLILQITIDQLRGDLPDKYMQHMGNGGFRYLKAHGIWYENAHYKHSVTQTSVGHATLATGAYPSEHGIIANNWYDRNTKAKIYSIEDNSSSMLRYDENKSIREIGCSPKNIMSSTFSDELFKISQKKSKIFAISLKDRGAVTLAGDHGKAFWFEKDTGEFVTSSYYYDSYPSWVKNYNNTKRNNEVSNKAWETLLNPSQYMYKDNQKGEVNYANFGTVFPHQYGSKDDPLFNRRIVYSPFGDELLLDFTKQLVLSEKLAQGNETDFLAVSFSATDYIGHIFGPSSVEAQDNLLRLDKTLANLFKFIDKNIGLENTLIVLSSDHGAPEIPEHFHKAHIDSKHVYIKNLATNKDKLQKAGIDQNLIESFVLPNLYLNHEEIKKRDLVLEDVKQEIASKLLRLEGIGAAIVNTNLKNNTIPKIFLTEAARRNYNEKRSGDILLINTMNYIMNSQKKSVACNHGSPWKYDTFVPVIFAGYKIKAKNIHREIEPNQIVPTLSRIVGAKLPSHTTKEALQEVISALK